MPSNSNIGTPFDFGALLTELQAINQNTDGLEVSVDNIDLNTDTLEINTDGLEGLITATNTLITDTNTELASIVDVLQADCGTGDEQNVVVCGADFAGMLTQLQAINANTDTLEVNTDTLETLLATTNTTLGTIDTAVDALLPELQAINANTDTLETLIGTTNTTLTTINTKLNEACGGNPINVNVCNPSGTIDLTTLETCCAANTALLTTIDADTGNIATSTASTVTELQTANNTLNDISSNTGLTVANTANIDSSLNIIDTVLDNILLDTTAIETNTGNTATNVNTVNTTLGTTNTTLAAINTKLNEGCGGSPINFNNCSESAQFDFCFRAINAGTGYSVGDILQQISITETNSLPTALYFAWLNRTTQTVIYEDNNGTVTGTIPLVVDLVPCVEGTTIDLTTLETCCAANTALLTTIDADTGAISTNTANTVTQLTTANATLTTIDTAVDALLPELQAINANTDTLEVNTDTLEALITTTNTTLGTINTKLNEGCGGAPINVTVCNPTTATDLTNVEALLTAIDNNTDGLEALDTLRNTELNNINTELDNIEATLTNVETVLQANCGSGNEQNVNICAKPTATQISSIQDFSGPGAFTIIGGARHASIAIKQGQVSITYTGSGVSALFDAGETLSLPPVENAGEKELYSEIVITPTATPFTVRIDSHY